MCAAHFKCIIYGAVPIVQSSGRAIILLVNTGATADSVGSHWKSGIIRYLCLYVCVCLCDPFFLF